jgi:hypothetical protein
VTGIEQGVNLLTQAAQDPRAVPAAQQTLRNWRHRLDRLTVLDGVARVQVQKDIEVALDWLARVHADPLLFANREADAERQAESIRRRLVALVGEHGLD